MTDGPRQPPVDTADGELIARLRAGDEPAFAAIVQAWSPGLLRVARSYVSTADSAAEVVQDTWLAVIEGIDRFAARSSVKTWTYRILVNTAQRRGARESRTVPMGSVPAEPTAPTVDPARFQGPGERFPGHWREFPAPWPTPATETPEQAALSAEINLQVQDALAELPGRQRVVITLRDVEGLSSEEVCAVLEISASNQRVLLHRARATVRGRLDAYFADRPPQFRERP
ncbi:MAG: sigma-70 family RNA polymerase sigma factor [Nakamurella sp.]